MWEEYLQETGSTAAPSSAFQPVRIQGGREGAKEVEQEETKQERKGRSEPWPAP